MTIPFTQAPAEPQLKDVLNQHGKNLMLGLNCHHVGTIEAFDPDNQTATVKIAYKKTYMQRDAVTGVYAPVLVDYPLIIDAPVICLGGGAARLTFPITASDECLVLFNDRDLDNWFKGGSGAPVATGRLHSFADAVVLVGVRSLANVLEDYDAERAVLGNGAAKVAVGPELIEISNSTRNLNTLLQQLLTQLQSLTTAISNITVSAGTFTAGATPVTGASGTPVNAATITSIGSDLAATAAQIGELLE